MDPYVGGVGLTDGDILDFELTEFGFVEFPDGTIAQEVDGCWDGVGDLNIDVVFKAHSSGVGQAGSDAERFAHVGQLGGRLDAFDGFFEQATVVGESLFDACAVRRGDDHGGIVASCILDELHRFFACDIQATRFAVACLHACRMIDDVDPTFPDAIHPAPAGPDAGQDQ
ncbi:MAG: hypothetical protein LW699_14295 [Pirellula sp.]|nr:hypothetical protein [Pirellula sp.]